MSLTPERLTQVLTGKFLLRPPVSLCPRDLQEPRATRHLVVKAGDLGSVEGGAQEWAHMPMSRTALWPPAVESEGVSFWGQAT